MHEQDDDLAVKAKRILLEDLEKRRRQSLGYDRDSLLGLFNSQHRNGTMDGLGLPVTRLIVIGIIIAAVLYVSTFLFRVLPEYSLKIFLTAYLLFVGAWMAVRIVRLNQRILKMRNELGESRKGLRGAIASYGIVALLAVLVLFLF